MFEELTPYDLVPLSDIMNFKILCKQLANTPQEYKMFLNEMEIDEVFEYHAINAAILYCRNQK
jgi:hypothetical protein